MANIYKNAKKDLTTTDVTTLYTAPSDSRAIIKSILVCDDSNNGSTITATIINSLIVVFIKIQFKLILFIYL